MKRALITGITGQDGSYLAELLLEKGYEVYGIIRRSSTITTSRLQNIYSDPHTPNERLKLIYGDLTDASSVNKVIRIVKPDEVYNLGAQSHVKISFDAPEYTADTVAIGTLRLLEALKEFSPHTKFYQASSSEMFGKVHNDPQNEETPFYPRSPYGISKLFGHWITVNYREAYNMFACSGILFNHESPRRGRTFVTRKISRSVAEIKLGMANKLYLGNLEAKRDWGYAKDYVEAMWLMLQQEHPEDYVIATGEVHSVKEFAEEAFSHAGLDWEKYVKVDPLYYRPTEVDLLRGDFTKAKSKLGWEPKLRFKEIVHLMVDADIAALQKNRYSID